MENVEEVVNDNVDGKYDLFTTQDLTQVSERKMSEISSFVGSVIPLEIQARGPEAKLAFQKALQKGKVQVFRGRIMILGQERAGKTTLKKSMLGMPFNPEEESTVVVEVDSSKCKVDVDPSKCEVDVDQVTNWQRTERTKLDASHFVEDIARIVFNELKETNEEPKKTRDVTSLSEQVKLITLDVTLVDSVHGSCIIPFFLPLLQTPSP